MVNYFCHICRQGFLANTTQEEEEQKQEDVTCSHCGSEFVEEVENMPQEFQVEIPTSAQENQSQQEQNEQQSEQNQQNNQLNLNNEQNRRRIQSQRIQPPQFPFIQQATTINMHRDGQIRVEIRQFNQSQEMPLLLPFNENMQNNLAQFLSMQDMGRIGPPKTADFVIQTLEEIKIETNEECPICKDSIDKEDICKKLPCEHFFHSECVTKWLEKHNTCPVCRETLASEEELL